MEIKSPSQLKIVGLLWLSNLFPHHSHTTPIRIPPMERLWLVGGIPTPLKNMKVSWDYYFHWIGLRENLQENLIFNGKIYGFL